MVEKLVVSEWNSEVSHLSITQLAERKFNKIDLIPLTSDMQNLRGHMVEAIASLSKKLKTETPASLATWQELAGVVLCRVTIYNKRRTIEASKLLVDSYRARPNWADACHKDILNTLQPLEIELTKRYNI